MTRGIYFRGPVYGCDGYSEENLGLLEALVQSGIPVQIQPVGLQYDDPRILTPPLRDMLEGLKKQKVDPKYSIFYQSLWAHGFISEDRFPCLIARTMFETDRIPVDWLRYLECMQEIWVPTRFNMNTFILGGIDPGKLVVQPAGIDTSLFRPGLEPLKIPNLRSFVFLCVSKVECRKGIDVLLEAYLSEFRKHEDVTLVIKCRQSDIDRLNEMVATIRTKLGVGNRNCPQLVIITRPVSRRDMSRLYNSVNAFVLPSRGEGYGRPYLEALACQLPVIATRWGGQLDFLNDENSFLIDSQRSIPISSEVDFPYFAGHSWAEPSVPHLRQLMRCVISQPSEAQRRSALGRDQMVSRWDWHYIIRKWVYQFQRLQTMISLRPRGVGAHLKIPRAPW